MNAGHITFFFGQCPMSDGYFNLWYMNNCPKYSLQSLGIPRYITWMAEFNVQIDNIGGFSKFQTFHAPIYKSYSQWSHSCSVREIF